MPADSPSSVVAAPSAAAPVNRDLIIRSLPEGVEIALLENGRLVEIHQEALETDFNVGDVYLGRIRKLSPGLNAAFVDIGHDKEAFLHYSDLGPQLLSMVKFANGAINGTFSTARLDNFKAEADIDKAGQIGGVLKAKQDLLFQISKEPISTKGPRLSAEVNLPGRYVILTPFGAKVSVSKKIGTTEERKRLKTLVESLRPPGCGIIVRTAAEGRGADELLDDINHLLGQWDEIFRQLHRAKPPAKLLSELDKTSGLLRDLLSDAFSRIVVDDEGMYERIRGYLASIAPDKVDIVKLHRGSGDAFNTQGIRRQIQASFGKTVTVPSGAYLVIESTEAMHVIDVNSGNKVGRNHDDALLNVNLDAAREIARQVRLRDIGGLIVIDFIDMKDPNHRQRLVREMKEFMATDRAQHSILPLTKFGLMQITRQRVRPAIDLDTTEQCPTCKGTGEVNPTVLVVDEIERDLAALLLNRPKSKLTLTVHPFVQAYLERGVPNYPMRWLWRHQTWLRVRGSESLGLTEYKFFDSREEEVRFDVA